MTTAEQPGLTAPLGVPKGLNEAAARRRPLARGAALAGSVIAHVLVLSAALISLNNRAIVERLKRHGGEVGAVTVSLISLRGQSRVAPAAAAATPQQALFDRLAASQPAAPSQGGGAQSPKASLDDIFNEAQPGEESYDPGAFAGRRADADGCRRDPARPFAGLEPGRPPCRAR